MPIYAYKCASCSFEKDLLQKMSDAPLSTCPACGKATFAKQLTAPGFQLKGSGWYASDFKGGSGKANEKPSDKPATDAPKISDAPSAAAAAVASAPAHVHGPGCSH